MNPKLLAGTAAQAVIEQLDKRFPEFGFRFKRHFYKPDMAFALGALQRAGFNPRHVIDIGAYEGGWAKLCRSVFPDSEVMMVEPSPERRRTLESLCRQTVGLHYREAFLAASDGVVQFREALTNSGAAEAASPTTKAMPTTTLDRLVAGTSFTRPEMVKIDTQGHDLEVLRGAIATLQSVEVIVTEMSLIRLAPTAPTFRTFIDWLDDAGFRLLDIGGFIRRPVDDALWQIDAVFARRDSSLGSVARGW